jgi:hypothetical protein
MGTLPKRAFSLFGIKADDGSAPAAADAADADVASISEDEKRHSAASDKKKSKAAVSKCRVLAKCMSRHFPRFFFKTESCTYGSGLAEKTGTTRMFMFGCGVPYACTLESGMGVYDGANQALHFDVPQYLQAGAALGLHHQYVHVTSYTSHLMLYTSHHKPHTSHLMLYLLLSTVF